MPSLVQNCSAYEPGETVHMTCVPSSNAESAIFVRDAGRLTAASAGQSSNADTPISATPSAKVTSLREVQWMNSPFGI